MSREVITAGSLTIGTVQYGGYRKPGKKTLSDVNIPEVSISGSQHLQYSA